jgi:PAS domain S-box-containing protein
MSCAGSAPIPTSPSSARPNSACVRVARFTAAGLAELQTIYASAPIGLCVLDREFRYVRINEQLAQMNGLAATEHIGRTLREAVPDLAEQKETVCRQVLETGQPVVDVEISGQTRAMPGVTRYWLMSYFPLPNDVGEIVGINFTAQEITDRKRAEQQRQELLEAEQAARAELERYNRLKDEFLATVSHELRSPLNAILGWTRLLAKGKAEPGRALEIVERNASSLAQIVEDLLDMSRIISGKIHLQRSYADIGPLVRNVLDCIQLPAQAKGITVNSWIDPQLRPIPCDPNRIQQIIWNLMTNAVKFTPSGGQVWLRVAQESSSVIISVKDTGQGIPPEHLTHIFGRFQQVDSSISRKHGGLGLGLAIVRQLVELHGGTVEAQSEGENKGATFTVHLPWSRPSSERIEPSDHGGGASAPAEHPPSDMLLPG